MPKERHVKRSLALEQAYVHDVYSVIAINTSSCSPVRSHVKQFLFEEFESGSILLDVGCSDGKYLNLNSDIVIIGFEKCCEWFLNHFVKYNSNFCGDPQLITGDVMYLPFRDDFFDGVLCCGVLHHVSTVERRIRALKEMARIMKIGGKLLLTVTSGPLLGRELQSQDVLIKLDKLEGRCDASDESDTDESSSSCTSHYDNAMYEACNSPNSEFGSCYSFVRKALQRFSFTGSVLQSRRTSLNKSRTSKSSKSSSISKEDLPIELRNIEDDESLSAALDSPVDQKPTNNMSTTNTNSYSSIISSSSLFSIIKEHILSFQLQFKSKHNINDTSNKRNGFLQRKLSHHRISLPLHLNRNNKDSDLNVMNQNDDQLKESSEIKCTQILNQENISLKREVLMTNMHKSLSSDSLESRQANFGTVCKLVAYYSMPELYALNECSASQVSANCYRTLKNKPKLIELHPITFLLRTTAANNSQKQLQNQTQTNTIHVNTCSSQLSSESCTTDMNKRITPIEENENEMLEEEEMGDQVITESQQSESNKFAKKLLRQRSFSADYQPEVPKKQNEQPRRFSASPNIGATRAHANQMAHHQQISIDSEESFVTIIPAMRSTRESVTDVINNSDTFTDFDHDYLTSSTDDDACCEQMIGEEGEQTFEDDTSASIVSTKSTDNVDSDIHSSTPSPPTTLHRYFHIFRSGELEQLIEQNIQDLHVINSYYNEHVTSWCVVVEKVHVWTI